MSDYDVNDITFLGKGMKFPPQINKATGRFMTSSEKENIKESIYLILMTQKTERFMRPDFGSSIMQYTFMISTTRFTKTSKYCRYSGKLKKLITLHHPFLF